MDWNTAVTLIQVLGAAGFGVGVMPLLVAFVTTHDMPSQIKELIVLISCVGVAFIGCLIMQVDITNLLILFPTLLISSRLAYQHYWKPTGLAPWFEDLTTRRE